MAVVSGTYQTHQAIGDREDLADFISRISPEDTPFMTGAGVGRPATAVMTEWQTDTLAASSTTNAQLEGNDATFVTPDPTVRVANYLQISDKTLIVSGTLEAIDKAGRRSELALQLAKRGAELKLDQEAICLTNQAGDAGGAAVARKIASLNAWLKTNTNFATGGTPAGADPVYTSGVPGATRTDDSIGERAFTETIGKSVMQSLWTNGAKANVIMVGPVNKQYISANWSGIASRTIDISQIRPTQSIAAIDVYVGDFGTYRIVPSREQRERDAWFLDFNYVEIAYLRPYMVDKLAKTGDAEKRLLLAEWTLRVKNEAALGGAFDLATT